MKELPPNQLDPRIKSVWRLSDAIALTVVFVCLLGIGALLWAGLENAYTWIGIYFALCFVAYPVALAVFLAVVTPVRFARWRYGLSHDFLDIARGILWRKRYIVPFIRVQNTDTKQGPILRAFGLASVTVSTAAGSLEIPGLSEDEADEVRDKAAELARIAKEDV